VSDYLRALLGRGAPLVFFPKLAELTCPLNSRAVHGFIVALSDQARRSDPSPGLAGLSSAAKAPLWGAFALSLRGESFRARPTSPSARLALSGEPGGSFSLLRTRTAFPRERAARPHRPKSQ
jgi:hypothetical protein